MSAEAVGGPRAAGVSGRRCEVGEARRWALEREGVVEVRGVVGQIGWLAVFGGVVGVVALQLAEVAAFELEDDFVEEVHEGGDGLVGQRRQVDRLQGLLGLWLGQGMLRVGQRGVAAARRGVALAGGVKTSRKSASSSCGRSCWAATASSSAARVARMR